MKKIKKKTYFVTGASGFIGANITKTLLKSDVEVHICLRQHSNTSRLANILDQLHIHYLDLTDFETLNKVLLTIQPHFIIHCAEVSGHVRSFEKQTAFFMQGCQITINLMEACKFCKPQAIVCACSSLVYEPTEQQITEKTSFKPFCFRGLIKLSERNIIQYYATHFDIPVSIARILRAYGPMEQEDRLILQLFEAIIHQKPMRIAASNIMRDYIFIEDLAEAMIMMAHQSLNPGEEINLASGKSHNSEDILKIIENISQQKINKSETLYPAAPADRTSCQVDISKAQELLAWKPKVSLEEGLLKTYQWWKNHRTQKNIHE